MALTGLLQNFMTPASLCSLFGRIICILCLLIMDIAPVAKVKNINVNGFVSQLQL